MRDLYNITASEALSFSIEKVIEDNPELTKKQAKVLVLNALLYNVVIAEIRGQVNWLLDKEQEDETY